MKLIIYKRENEKPENYRKEGKIPGVIYGPEINSTSVYSLEKEFINFYQNYTSGLFDIEFEGKNLKGVLQEVQFHPITDKIIHFDIFVPKLTERIETKVHLEFVGEAPALKKGGVISIALNEIPILALPTEIPEKIVVDLSKLEEVGQTIYVKDLSLPPGVKVLIDLENPVISIIEESIIEEEKEAEPTSEEPSDV